MTDRTIDSVIDARGDDPVVAAVRGIREAIWAEVGEDYDRLFERILKVEAAERAAGREFVEVPTSAERPDVAA